MENKPTNEEKVLENLVISPEIDVEMSRQAALFAQMAFAAAHAKNRADQQKLALEMLEADLDTAARKALTAQGEKIREAAIEAIIKKNGNWVDMYNAYLRERLELGIVEAATEAFKQRAMMLSGLGAMRRAEMEQEQGMQIKTVSGRATEVLTRKFNREKGRVE